MYPVPLVLPTSYISLGSQEDSTMLSSWDAEIYLGRFPAGPFCVWVEKVGEGQREFTEVIDSIDTPEQMLRALADCSDATGFDVEKQQLLERLGDIAEFDDEFARGLQECLAREG